jgi:imidazolonepropionase-like amidohydrolase
MFGRGYQVIGMMPIDSLRGATSLLVDIFEFGDCGRTEVGRRADLVLVKGDVRELLANEPVLRLPACGVGETAL